ncbi:MAG: hypothetical protein A3B68_06670 [Candidatus Melainabacteria bacterium RIFCSPHIGHO2_02_FULL_34_12]|nr:MAG: hypothetical protein A3B68_06670 [Candidatus Melainabacteria bacterium RIFCSPHIGHO2_02_FULL_34_12]
MKILQVIENWLFGKETPHIGSKFNTRIPILAVMTERAGHTELANLYKDLFASGFKDSDAVVDFIQNINPATVAEDERTLLDRILSIPMKHGWVVHIDVAGEAAVKSGEIRKYVSSDEPATISFTSNQRPAWLDNGQTARADAA